MTLTDVRWRLYGMMFLVYFSIGAWAVTMASYLSATGVEGGLAFNATEVGWIYSTFAVAGILAPFLVGPLADRWFRGERVLAFSSLAAGLMLLFTALYCDGNQDSARQTHIMMAKSNPDPAAIAASTAVRVTANGKVLILFALMLGYCFFMQLGSTLANALTMRNHPQGSDGYSRTRMWGTIGWIVSGNVVGLCLNSLSTEPIYLAAASSALLGVFSLLLPKTPPMNKEKKYLPALRLFRDRMFCIFIVIAFLGTMFNQFYGVYAHKTFTDLGIKKAEQWMTIGQGLEVFCMFVIPLLRPKQYLKLLMGVAIVGWIVRAVVMVWGSNTLLIAVAMPMHGWSFAFFYTAAQTFLRSRAGDDLAAGAQGIISFITSGFGALVGNIVASFTVEWCAIGPTVDWHTAWLVPLFGCVAMLIVFLVFFHPHRGQVPTHGEVLQV